MTKLFYVVNGINVVRNVIEITILKKFVNGIHDHLASRHSHDTWKAIYWTVLPETYICYSMVESTVVQNWNGCCCDIRTWDKAIGLATVLSSFGES